MPPRQDQLGERISGLEAKVDGMDRYAHEKWHDLNNTLQPLALLPEKMTRDIAKMQGSFQGQINSVSKDIERTITSAIENAIMPINKAVTDLDSRVSALEKQHEQETGAKNLLSWFLQSPLVGWLVAAGLFFVALLR